MCHKHFAMDRDQQLLLASAQAKMAPPVPISSAASVSAPMPILATKSVPAATVPAARRISEKDAVVAAVAAALPGIIEAEVAAALAAAGFACGTTTVSSQLKSADAVTYQKDASATSKARLPRGRSRAVRPSGDLPNGRSRFYSRGRKGVHSGHSNTNGDAVSPSHEYLSHVQALSAGKTQRDGPVWCPACNNQFASMYTMQRHMRGYCRVEQAAKNAAAAKAAAAVAASVVEPAHEPSSPTLSDEAGPLLEEPDVAAMASSNLTSMQPTHSDMLDCRTEEVSPQPQPYERMPASGERHQDQTILREETALPRPPAEHVPEAASAALSEHSSESLSEGLSDTPPVCSKCNASCFFVDTNGADCKATLDDPGGSLKRKNNAAQFMPMAPPIRRRMTRSALVTKSKALTPDPEDKKWMRICADADCSNARYHKTTGLCATHWQASRQSSGATLSSAEKRDSFEPSEGETVSSRLLQTKVA